MADSHAERQSTERQSPIDAHGIIGDMRSAALVNDKGSIDFFCWPEFDSPSIFCSLLDSPAAGIFQLAPDLPDARREQIYLPDTNVLQTRWLSERAVVEVTDLLPIGDSEDDLPLLIRRVRVVSGTASIRMRCAVRQDYARAHTKARAKGADICFEAPHQPGLRLVSVQCRSARKEAPGAEPVARGLAPARLRSSRKIGTRVLTEGTRCLILGPLSRSSGGKPPRHKCPPD